MNKRLKMSQYCSGEGMETGDTDLNGWEERNYPDSKNGKLITENFDLAANPFHDGDGDGGGVGGERNDSRLPLSSLEEAVSIKLEQLVEMQSKFQEAAMSINELITQKDAMLVSYNQEIQKLQQDVSKDLSKIMVEQERAKHELEAESTRLEEQEKQLQEWEKHNETEMKKLQHHKETGAILEQKTANQEMLRLAQQHKREKDALSKRLMELGAQLDAKQAMELEIEQMKGALKVMGHMGENESCRIREMEEKLEEKEEELKTLVALSEALRSKREIAEAELDQADKELIQGFEGMGNAGRMPTIGVKRGAGEEGGKRRKGKGKLVGSEEEAELWHWEENRKATRMEGIEFMVSIWKRLKRVA